MAHAVDVSRNVEVYHGCASRQAGIAEHLQLQPERLRSCLQSGHREGAGTIVR